MVGWGEMQQRAPGWESNPGAAAVGTKHLYVGCPLTCVNFTVDFFSCISPKATLSMCQVIRVHFQCQSLHLLLEAVVDLQLHEQDALADIQRLLQLIERRVDVVLDGALLIGQLLQDL